jgi:outer membrane immunogenic protein
VPSRFWTENPGSVTFRPNAESALVRKPLKKLLCASTAASALLLEPVAAADLSVAPIYKATPPAAVPTWSGSYVGISGGGTWGSAVVHNDTTGLDQTPRFDLSGAIVGVTSGAQLQNGNWVIGYEGDTSITSKKGSAAEFPPNVGFSNEAKERWLSTFRGRVGVTQNNWLIYATAGGALANVQNTITSPVGTQISEKHWHWGWTAGAGVEVKLSQDWSAKMEYLYVGLQDKSYFNPAPSAVFPSNQSVRVDDHIVRVGVNYKLPWSVLDTFFKR